MRNSFVKQMLLEMKNDKSIIFLTGDLGYNALEPIQKKFPDRFINVGIAEANMIGVASGLALMGRKVVVYSIASFATLRPYEQIRNDICYHNLDVKIVGVGGGFNYAGHGVTHHTIEDLAIMSVLPNMKVFNPAFDKEAIFATREAIKDKGPVFLRLGKNPNINMIETERDLNFSVGQSVRLKEGKEIIFVFTGNIIDEVFPAVKILEEKIGKSIGVLSMPCIKPIDEYHFKKAIGDAQAIFTIEEHGVRGGLGDSIRKILISSDLNPKIFYSFGVDNVFVKDVGDRAYLLKCAGLDRKSIAKITLERLKVILNKK